MAFDQSTRGCLQKLVNSCRGLLSEEFSIQLQQAYGLDPKTGEVTPMARLTHLDDRQRHTAEVLRQTLAHYLGANTDDTDHRIAVLDRMVREQAFTVLRAEEVVAEVLEPNRAPQRLHDLFRFVAEGRRREPLQRGEDIIQVLTWRLTRDRWAEQRESVLASLPKQVHAATALLRLGE